MIQSLEALRSPEQQREEKTGGTPVQMLHLGNAQRQVITDQHNKQKANEIRLYKTSNRTATDTSSKAANGLLSGGTGGLLECSSHIDQADSLS